MKKIRVKQRVNERAAERITDRVNEICTEGAKVVAAFADVHETPSVRDILECDADSGAFVQMMQERKKSEYENLPPLVADCVREQINEKINAAAKTNRWREVNNAEIHEPYISIDEDFGMHANTDVIELHCTQWIEEPQEIAALERHRAAADALNAFFGGDIPLNWPNLFDCVNGQLVPNIESTNYAYFAHND